MHAQISRKQITTSSRNNISPQVEVILWSFVIRVIRVGGECVRLAKSRFFFRVSDGVPDHLTAKMIR